MHTTVQTYAPDNYKQYVTQNTADIAKNKTDILTIPGGMVVVDRQNNTIGVFDKDMTPIPETLCNNSGRILREPRKNNIQYIDADAIYCGDGRMFHFGDFLLEGTAFLYPFLNKKYRDAKFVFCSPTINALPKYVFDILAVAGIRRDNIILATRPLKFNTVYIPQRAQNYLTGRMTSDSWRKTCQHMAQHVKHGYKYNKIYVSRAKMDVRRVFGEERIQKIFEQNGYKVIYPETMPFEQQIAMVKNCKYLAGCAGTALHLAMFMAPGGTVIQIKRNTDIGDNIVAQHVINQTVGLNLVLVWGSVESQSSEHFTPQPQIIGMTPYMQKFLDDYGFKYSDKDLQSDTNAMSEYDAQLRKYNRSQVKTLSRKIRVAFIKLITNPIPYRGPRERLRHKLKKMLRIK